MPVAGGPRSARGAAGLAVAAHGAALAQPRRACGAAPRPATHCGAISSDPILRLSESAMPRPSSGRSSRLRLPAIRRGSGDRGGEEAEARRRGPRTAVSFGRADGRLYQSIAREFSNDPDNIIERSRPRIVPTRCSTSARRCSTSGPPRNASPRRARSVARRPDRIGRGSVALNTIANWYDVVPISRWCGERGVRRGAGHVPRRDQRADSQGARRSDWADRSYIARGTPASPVPPLRAQAEARFTDSRRAA